MSDDFDPMAPDAPLVALLSKSNLLQRPDESHEAWQVRLRETVKRCRTMSVQPMTLKAKLNAESAAGTSKVVRESKTKKAMDLLGELGL